MSLYIDTKMIFISFELLWFALYFSHQILNLSEDLQCSESLENFTLELHRLPVDSIQLSVY